MNTLYRWRCTWFIAWVLFCLMFVGCGHSDLPNNNFKRVCSPGGAFAGYIGTVELEDGKYYVTVGEDLRLYPKLETINKPVLLGVMKGMPVYGMEVDGKLYYMTPVVDEKLNKTTDPFNPFDAVPKAEKPDKEL